MANNAAGPSLGPDQILTTARLRRTQIRAGGTSSVTCGNGRCILTNLTVNVGVRDPNRAVAVRTPAALRNIRLLVRCTRGCTLNRTFRLKRGTIRARAVSGSARQFVGATEGSPGRRVRVSVALKGGEYRVNLLRLFSDGRGHPYLLREGQAEIQVIVTKPGYAGSAQIIRAQRATKRLVCNVKNGRPVECRAVT